MSPSSQKHRRRGRKDEFSHFLLFREGGVVDPALSLLQRSRCHYSTKPPWSAHVSANLLASECIYSDDEVLCGRENR